MDIPKFIISENFSWLLKELEAYDDPKVTYKWQGRKDLRGGLRMMYREYVDFAKNVIITKSPSPTNVSFGATTVECDEWHVLHNDYQNKELKERYPKNGYTCLVTSRNSLLNGTATRYYCSCDCMAFQTLFKSEMLKYGYTNGTTLPSTGVKKQQAAVCKHLFSILTKKYADFISKESGPEESAFIVSKEIKAQEQPLPAEPIQAVSPSEVKKRGRIAKTTDERKADYEKVIRRSLKFFSNVMPNTVEVYKNSRAKNASGELYKKYKFMVKKYFQGWVIVFTNPALNPLRDKIKDKELVPIMTRLANKTVPSGDTIVVYTKYFSKDELMNMIKSETREIQQNQIDKLNKSGIAYTLTEGIEILDSDDNTSILHVLLGVS
jgi:hypothetical protein